MDIKKINVGDFSMYEAAPAGMQFYEGKLFGISIKYIAIAGIIFYLLKK